ncbi:MULTISPECIES: TonB-dependent siderophore receptor [Burkholderiaceae]|uniref:TonB-dependent receptor n=1 Tax=Burkholderiaceae TaxID=119060 RepID=UPI000964E927|nr:MULTISPECIES: TonB-dependent siderophore receptor [Burkholderiaceae]MCG1040426.1 TonB-dependent siderophore receptor [Mycetohabitans sp. B7]SIT74834.1 catecholate siderophore receptor [Burkholderia sp. b14]
MTKMTPLATTLVAAFTVPMPALAQSAQPDSNSQDTQHGAVARAALPAVRVTGDADRADFQVTRASVGAKRPTTLRDIPQEVVVINKALMQSQGVASFADALRNVPGITIGGAEGGQIGNNINLRGFTARTDIYLDGFRDRGQYYRDTFNLESIDVLYGPSSMLFGRGSTGGVINQASKKANLTRSAEVSGTVGTGDDYRTTVDVNQPISDTAAVRVNAFGQSVGTTRDAMRNKDFGIAPQVRLGIGTPTEITLSALIQHNRDMPDYGVPAVNGHPVPVGRERFYGYTGDRTVQDVQTLSARIEHRFSDELKLRNQTQFSHYATDARATNAASVVTGPLAGSRALSNGSYTSLPLSNLYVKLMGKDRVINDHSLYNATDVEWKVATGALKHDLIAGIELGHETYNNQSYTATGAGMPSNVIGVVPLTGAAYVPRPADVVRGIGNLARSSANSIGVYVNDTVSLTRQWKVVGGVRWDHYQAHIANSMNAPSYAAQTNSYTSVRGGVIYQPDDAQSYYLSYGTSFNPSLEALTLTNGTQNLKPETNRSYEVGNKWDLLGGTLSISQSLFNIDKSNARTQDATGAYSIDGDMRVRGYQFGASGRITDKWQLYGGYTYLNSRITGAKDGTQGNTPANTPRNMLTLWMTYEFMPHWQAGGGLNYMSTRYAANNNRMSVGGYTRWDAMLAYHAKQYDVQLNLLNVTDKRYYDALIPSDGGRAVPGLGRTLLATFNYRV